METNKRGSRYKLSKASLNVIREHVRQKWEEWERYCKENAIAFPQYPSHGPEHSQKVEHALEWVIGERNFRKLKKIEQFLLRAASWFHDIGMIPKLFEEDDLNSPNHLNEVRKKHHERSARYIDILCKGKCGVNPKQLGLDDQNKIPLEKICLYHRKNKPIEELDSKIGVGGYPVRVKLLTAYFRIADAIEIADPTRASLRDQDKDNQEWIDKEPDPEAAFQWLKTRFAQSPVFNPDKYEITIQVKCPQNLADKAIPLCRLFQDELQDELDSVKAVLIEEGSKLKLPIYLFAKSEPTEDVAMGKEDKAQFIRLIPWIETRLFAPNAGAAIERVIYMIEACLQGADDKNKVEKLERYITHIIEPFIKERPCHVFHVKVQQVVNKVLQSMKLRNLTESEAIKKIERIVGRWKKKRENFKRVIPEKAAPFLSSLNPVLLYGYSSSVIRALEGLPREVRPRLKIYICEGSTKTRYGYNNRLRYCDGITYAKELLKKGFCKDKIFIVPDLAASNLFSRGEVTKVFFGANGIGLDGSVAHALGHLAIADSASIYGIPVYVIAESIKIGDLRRNPTLTRDQPWLTTDWSIFASIKHELSGSIAWEEFYELQRYNPREDIVPPEKITMIITELGPFIPQRLLQELSEQHLLNEVFAEDPFQE